MAWRFVRSDSRAIRRLAQAGAGGALALGTVALGTAVLVLGLVGGPATGAAGEACREASHRFESFALFAPALERAKRILVYLPPGYECAPARRYPVFYFNDGHDLFDWSPDTSGLEPALAAEIAAREAWYGSWRLDAQLDRALAARRLPPLIVVGIASDDGMRSRDLVPVPWAGSSEGRGAAYGDFVARIVVPAIDRRFRTLADRRCRGIGGASLGAISALQIGLAHPERFGLALAFSPVLADPAIAGYLAAAWPAARSVGPSRLLIDFDDDPIGRAGRAWFATIVGSGPASARETALVQTPGGRHAIASWAMRVVPALQHLLAPCAE
jgi:enterochelin esterase-like enzyme